MVIMGVNSIYRRNGEKFERNFIAEKEQGNCRKRK